MPRASVPTLLQVESVECGAAALGMVLAHHGRWVSLGELRRACNVSRDGISAAAIMDAAEHYGMRCRAFKKEPEDLAGFGAPFIVFWHFNHFLVVERVGRRGVVVNDPAGGRRTLTPREFDHGFTGVVLLLEPGPSFRRGGRKPSVLRSLLSHLKGSRPALAFIVLLSLLGVLPGVVVPTFSRVFVDYYLVERYESWLLPLFGGMLAMAALTMLLTGLQQSFLLKLRNKIALAQSARFYWRLLRLPVNFFAHRPVGDVGQRLMLNDEVAGQISGPLAASLLDLVTLLAYGAVLLQYDATLTLVAAAAAAANLALLRFFSGRLADRSRKVQMDRGKLASVGLQGFSMLDSYRAMGTEHLFFERFTGAHAKVLNGEQALGRWRALLQGLPALSTNLTSLAILGLGAVRVMQGEITVGQLVAFQALTALFTRPVASLVSLGGMLQETAGSLLRIEDVMREEEDPEFARSAESADPLSGALELAGVGFRYAPHGPPVLSGIDLAVPRGRRVALVGRTGSGKSTLANLLCGLCAPTEGRIRFDGVPLEQLPRAAFRAAVAAVEQVPVFMEGTVRENLTLWNDAVEEQDLVEAARAAAIHDEISARAGAYDARIGQHGLDFSGGERQRLAIVRALVQKPSVLVLDEATSALDAGTEARVLANIARLGITCFVISHRLSAIQDCDEIVVLREGAVVERGRHAELAARPGVYRELMEFE